MAISEKLTDGSSQSDDESGNEEQYARLEASVLELDNTQRVKPARKNELGASISEFHVKTKSGKHELVNTNELANVLGNKAKHFVLDKAITKSKGKSKTLNKPLEKPVAERLKRNVGYEVANKQLSRWDPVVEVNRIADHTVFPLNEPKLSQKESNFYTKYPSELQKKHDQLMEDEGLRAPRIVEEDEEFPLTFEEMIERRREMAGVRARQSYREAKAYRQSKIKSKKYHRIQKKEKVKQQIKEFEMLQKVDPDAALKKLEELERGRAEERATLRHKSTGKWAKNLTVRAKYDKESRKALSEQLSISRDIAMKPKLDESSDDESELNPGVLETALSTANENPWSLEVSSEVNEFISGFKKYWKVSNAKKVEEPSIEKKKSTEQKTTETTPSETRKSEENLKTGSTSAWKITDCADNDTRIHSEVSNFDIDDAFYLADKKLADNITKKFNVLKGKIKHMSGDEGKKSKKLKRRKQPEQLPEVKLKKARWQVERAEVDQELEDTSKRNSSTARGKSVIEQLPDAGEKTVNPFTINIDPDQFLKVTPKVLRTPLAEDVADNEEVIDDDDPNHVIMEAFADDNCVAEFEEQKKEEEKATQLEVVSELPGWGSWGGEGIAPGSGRRKRRFLQIPKLPERKDSKLPDVIINEESNPNIEKHMVKEVPFPFQSVQAFEANIRAPVSREWVPEKALDNLIRPAVITRQGTIIEPISDDVLLRNQRKFKSAFTGKKKVKTAK